MTADEPDQTPEPLTVFINIPLTGASRFIRSTYPPGSVQGISNVLKGTRYLGATAEVQESILERVGDAQVLSGNVPFAIRRYLPEDTRYVTFLREPVERALSQYYSMKTQRSLEDFAARRNLVENVQTRMLSDVVDPAARVDEEVLEQAKRNLDTGFAAFGLSERFDESLVLVTRRLGLGEEGHVPQPPTPGHAPEAPSKLKDLADELNEFDNQLYRWACERFSRIVDEESVDFELALADLRATKVRALLDQLEATTDELSEQVQRIETKFGLDAARAAGG